MESIFWGSGTRISCADAAPHIIQAMTTIAKADLHIHESLLRTLMGRGDADRHRVIVLCDGGLHTLQGPPSPAQPAGLNTSADNRPGPPAESTGAVSPGPAVQRRERETTPRRLRRLRKEVYAEINRLIAFLDASELDQDERDGREVLL